MENPAFPGSLPPSIPLSLPYPFPFSIFYFVSPPPSFPSFSLLPSPLPPLDSTLSYLLRQGLVAAQTGLMRSILLPQVP